MAKRHFPSYRVVQCLHDQTDGRFPVTSGLMVPVRRKFIGKLPGILDGIEERIVGSEIDVIRELEQAFMA